MPLPTKTIRVLPNPWGFIHHDHGPQGVCHRDTGGRGADPSFVGAELDAKKTRFTEVRKPEDGDHRHHRQVTVFAFPVLNEKLDGPTEEFKAGIEFPKSAYYLDRLRDGDLVPADSATASATPCKFKSLAEARDAGVATFEANYGEGVFAEAFKDLAFKKAATESARATESAAPAATTGAESSAGGRSGAATNDDAKAEKAGKGASK